MKQHLRSVAALVLATAALSTATAATSYAVPAKAELQLKYGNNEVKAGDMVLPKAPCARKLGTAIGFLYTAPPGSTPPSTKTVAFSTARKFHRMHYNVSAVRSATLCVDPAKINVLLEIGSAPVTHSVR
jgi:hypothetical protein